eukprot:g7366.t1
MSTGTRASPPETPFVKAGKLKGGTWAWVPDEIRVFKPVFVVPQDGGANYTDESKNVYSADQVTKIDNPENIDIAANDLVHLDEVNEPFILQSIGQRFAEDKIYTNLGSIVISMNPFKWIDGLYGPKVIEKYSRIRRQGIAMPPHIYTIADTALCAIVESGKDQSVIISGESGAGKTEAVKKCLEYLATVAGSSVKNVEQRILSANPVLEAFGNAKTLRNNNSSRFGKWMQIHFSSSAKIIGCSNTSYLLEKSRVVYQDEGERNFHAFYLLCKGASAAQLSALHLSKNPGDYKYLSQSRCYDAEGIDDKAWFQEMATAFVELGMDPETEADGVFRLLAGILLLGNISFVADQGDDERSQVVEDSLVADVADVLGIDPKHLNTCLIERQFQSGGRSSLVKVPMKAAAAKDNRDALCKEMYARLFLWIIARVNEAMEITGKTAVKIGVLDIFGFEIFEKNSFEQICINFANEKLQQHFTNYTFKMENEIYLGEGIDFKGVTFIDNQNVLDLLEKKPSGLLSILDEELRVPRGSAAGFYNKLSKRHAKNDLFRAKSTQQHSMLFTVQHYAGTVSYDASLFLEKNRDALFDDLLSTLATSNKPLISKIFGTQSMMAQAAAASASPGRRSTRKSGKNSISALFRGQLNSLMKTLYDTSPHYIRCIKPNPAKVSGRMSHPLVMEQLRYSGVFEAVQIRKSGYPFRHPHEVFWKRFKCLVTGIDPRKHSHRYKHLCGLLLDALKSDIPDSEHCLIGNNLVLYRSAQNKKLESSRGIIRLNAAITCQEAIRFGVTRIMCLRWRRASERLRKAYKNEELDELQDALENCEKEASQENAYARTRLGKEVALAQKLATLLIEKRRIKTILTSLSSQSPLEHVEEYREILAAAKQIAFVCTEVKTGEVIYKKASNAMNALHALVIATEEFDFEQIVKLTSDVKKSQNNYAGFGRLELQKAQKAKTEIEAEWTSQLPQLVEALGIGAVCSPDASTKATDWVQKSIFTIETTHLAAAAATGKAANLKSSRGRLLVKSIVTMKDVRDLLQQKRWADAIELLDTLPMIDQAIEVEVNNIRSAYAIRTQLPLLLDALQNGQASGPSPSNTASLDGTALSKALAAFEECNFASPDIVFLVETCQFVLKLRTGWVENAWAEISMLIENARLDDFHELARPEILLAQNNVKYYDLVALGTTAVIKNRISGKVGKLDCSAINTESVDRILKQLDSFESNYAEFLTLKKTVKALNDLRKSMFLVQGNSLDLPAVERQLQAISGMILMKEASPETDLCRNYLRDIRARESIERGLVTGNIVGPKGEVQRSSISVEYLQHGLRVCDELSSRSRLTEQFYNCGKLVLTLRSSVMDDDWEAVKMTLKQNDLPASKGLERSTIECLKVKAELHEREACNMFQGALLKGKISREGDDIVYNSILTDVLESALQYARHHDCGGKIAMALSEACTVLKGLRMAAKTQAWDELRTLLQEIPQSVLLHISDEHEIAKNQIDNIDFVKDAERSLKEGGPVGLIGNVALEMMDTIKLEKLIVQADSVIPLVQRSRTFLESCKLIFKNRKALIAANWDGIEIPADLSAVEPAAHSEIHRVEKEKDNHVLVTAFMVAIRQGRVRGQPGSLKVEEINADKIVECFDLGKKLGIRSEHARKLNEEATRLRQLRIQCKESSWAQLSMTIANIDNYSGAFSEGSKTEVALVRKHYHNHHLLSISLAAMEKGSALGVLGSLDCESVDLQTLDDALAYERRFGSHSDDVKQRIAVVKDLRQLRDALRRSLWKKVPDHLARLKSYPKGTLAQEVETEIKRAQDEVDHKRIIDKLNFGLKTGRITGRIGAIKRSNIKCENLEIGVAFADKITCKAPLTKDLREHADSILNIRRSLLKCLWSQDEKKTQPDMWEELQRHILQAHRRDDEEVKKAEDELHNFQNIRLLTQCLSENNVSGTLEQFDVGDIAYDKLDSDSATVASRGCKTAEAKFLFGITKQLASLRRHVVKSDWKLVESVSSTIQTKLGKTEESLCKLLPKSVKIEIDLCKTKAVDNIVIASLENALSEGKSTGSPLKLDLVNIKTLGLEAEISLSESTGCKTLKSKRLLAISKSILALRLATKDAIWVQVGQCLNEQTLSELSDADLCHEEVTTVRNAFEEHQIIQHLNKGLNDGQAKKVEKSKGNHLDVTTVNTTVLEDALTNVNAIGCKTSYGRNLKVLAETTLNIRRALECGELEKAGDEAETAIRVGVSSDEISAVQIEYRNRHAYNLIKDALERGGIQGTLGNLDFGSVETSKLEHAIEVSESVQDIIVVLKAITESAKFVLKVRFLLRKQQWQTLDTTFAEISYNLGGILELCHKELSIVIDEINDRKVNAQLLSGLEEGATTGSIGALQLMTINTDALSHAIASSEKGNLSPNTSQTLQTAKLILRLRQCINRDMWEAVKVDVNSTDAATLVPKTVLTEAENYYFGWKIVNVLDKSIKIGTMRLDSGGNILRDAIETTQLAQDIKNLEDMDTTNAVAIDLFEGAKYLLELRETVLNNHWTEFERVLSRDTDFKAEIITSEVRVALLLLHDVQIINDITLALGGLPGDDTKLEPAFRNAKVVHGGGTSEEAKAIVQMTEYVLSIPLGNALEEGGAAGDLDSFDISPITTENIEEAIVFAVEHFSLLFEHSQSLLKTARYVCLVRKSLIEDSESLVIPDIVTKSRVDNMDIEARDELVYVYHHARNVKAQSALTRSLSKGRIQGTFDNLVLDFVDIEHLRQVIEDSSSGYQLTSATKSLLEVANFVELVRTHINDRGRLGPLVLNAPKSIPECADDEMSLVRDYYYNWHLRETIENMFTDSLPAKEELITVVKLASEMTNKDARCKLLINSSQCMLDIHECANAPAEEWVPKIQFALNKSEEYGKQLHERIISEVERLRAKLEDKQAAHMLREAMKVGGPQGDVGNIDGTNITTTALDAVIKDVENFVKRSHDTETLLRSARIIRIARTALKDGSWKDVEKFTNVCTDAAAEFALICAELWNKKMQESLAEAMSRGKVIGRVGNLRTEVVHTEGLAIALAECAAQHEISPTTKEFLDTANLLLYLRRGISGNVVDSHSLRTQIEEFPGKMSDVAVAEINLIKAEISLNAALTELRSAISHQSLSALKTAIEVGENAKNLNSDGRQLLRLARLMERLLNAEKNDDWGEMNKVLGAVDETEEALPTEIVMKFHSLRVRAANHNARLQLIEALSRDQVKGTVQALDLSEVSIDRIDRALMATRNIENLNSEVRDLATTALATRECRRAIQSEKLYLLQDNKLMTGETNCHEVAMKEITLIRDLLREKTVSELLKKALLSKMVDTGTRAIDDALLQARKVGCSTPESQLLYESVQVICHIRQLLGKGDWDGLINYMKSSHDVVDLAHTEVEKTKSDCFHYSNTVLMKWKQYKKMQTIELYAKHFKHRCRGGGATGSAGKIITSSIRLQLLDRSLELANDLGCNSSETQNFYRTGRVVQQLRVAAKREDWLEVEHLLNASVPQGIKEIESGTTYLDNIVHAELSLLINHVVDMKMVNMIISGLDNGAIRTDVQSGEVNMDEVDPKPLATALTFAQEQGARSNNAQKLIRASTLIQRVRTALVARDWAGVFDVVHDASGLEMCKKEMSAALNAVSNMRSAEALRHAIEHHYIDGVVGDIDIAKVSLQELDAALDAARDAATASKRVESLVNTAHVVRRLRHAILEDDWDEIQTIIGNAAMLAATSAFASEAEAEINLCLEELEDRKLQKLLVGAMSRQGTKYLKDAIALSQTTVLIHSEQTQNFISTATFLAEIRGAFEAGEMDRIQAIALMAEDLTLTKAQSEEVKGIIVEAKDVLAIRNLESAINSSGRAIMVNGHLDTTSVSRSRLLLAISDAKNAELSSQKANMLLALAEGLSDLRGFLREDNWSEVRKVLHKLQVLVKVNAGEVPRLALEEVRTAHKEAMVILTNERYSEHLPQVVTIQSLARQNGGRAKAQLRRAAIVKVQTVARMHLASVRCEQLRVLRDQTILDDREREVQARRFANVEKWNLAARLVVANIEEGVRAVLLPAQNEGVDSFRILSIAYKNARRLKLHLHPNPTIVAHVIRCERYLKRLLETEVHPSGLSNESRPHVN